MENNKVVLVIMDGFGASALTDGNAVLSAKTPFLDKCWGNCPKALLRASGEEVGLSWGEMGNSEVGHINLGTGRIIMQDLPRINSSIESGSFFKMEYLIDACSHAKKNNSTLHLVGLISTGGVHAHVDHLLALLDLAKMQGVKSVAIHCITDGRDMSKQSSEGVIKKIQEKINKNGVGVIATVIGRFYAMDRDKNWDRIQSAYELMTLGKGDKFEDPMTGIKSCYDKGLDDEKITPIILDEKMVVKDNDAMIFYNFRQDRAMQLADAFINPSFKGFKRDFIKNLRFVSFVSYGNEATPLVDVAYVSEDINGQLSKIVSAAKMGQLHIAETEKYAHVTYFFNGGVDDAFSGEERIIVPSAKVDSYDKLPQMSAGKIVEEFEKFYKSKNPNFSVINFANADMVGHTGKMNAAIKAVEYVDEACKQIAKIAMDGNTTLIITADHGNADQMINPQTKEEDKQHTTNPVPFVILPKDLKIGDGSKVISLEEKIAYFATPAVGVLADVAPTVLDLLGLKTESQMTGNSLKDAI